ncbi:MAG: OmpA family protein [Saprospiraceae bacterium]|nr:OmpA family protein [Saprospiraceae bacterium]
MRKLTFTLAILFICYFVNAQSPTTKHGLSFNVTIFDYYSPFNEQLLNAEGNTTLGGKIGFHTNLVGPLNLEIPLRIGVVQLPTPDNLLQPYSEDKFLGNLDALLQFQLAKSESLFVPYLSAGLGAAYIEDLNITPQVPVGVGLDIKLSRNLYLQGRSEYRLSFKEIPTSDLTYNNLTHNLGFKILLGKGASTPKTPVDSDGDGLADLLDKCPTQAGKASLNGCPDADDDGIADEEDKCPTEAGVSLFQGCPDTDNDGVQDTEDACPNVAGTIAFKGCPDTDGDGIEDAKDECPNAYGSPEFRGCPDTDGDGVPDSKDRCPNAVGTIATNGCPDTDGDGVSDDQDACPTTQGSASNRGCPVKEISKEDKATLEFAAQNIEFEINSSYFKKTTYEVLDQVADILLRYSEFNVNIDGYTDNVGADKYNQWLSEKRAERCYNYLINKGINAERMKFTGYGETNPVADNNTADGREKNRRVEFNLYPVKD